MGPLRHLLIARNPVQLRAFQYIPSALPLQGVIDAGSRIGWFFGLFGWPTCYPLRAPAVRPLSSRFWKMMYTTSVGSIVIVIAANSAP